MKVSTSEKQLFTCEERGERRKEKTAGLRCAKEAWVQSHDL